MASQLCLLGTNHETAPIAMRERLAVTNAELPQALRRAMALEGVQEAYIISTCNRTELYMVGEESQCMAAGRRFLAQLGHLPEDELAPYLYEMTARECVSHIFFVAAGANSMIVGDAQILGQMRESFAVAGEIGALGKTLNALVRKALQAGKRCRSQTNISSKAASLSYAAVEVAKREWGDLSTARLLIAGAGKMGQLMAEILADNGAREILFANRTHEKAVALAERFRGRAVEFGEMGCHLRDIDIAVAVTEAPCFIMQRDEIHQALGEHLNKRLILIDLGTPRNIDESARDLKGAVLYNIDDLQGVIQSNLLARQEELTKVNEIVAGEVEEFMAWYNSTHLGPTIQAPLEMAETIRKEELQTMDGKLAGLSPRERNVVDMATSRMLKRLLHLPVTRLKAAAALGNGEELAYAVQALFQLDEAPSR